MSQYDPQTQAIIRQLQAELEAAAQCGGCNCPICGERAQWYKRSLGKKQAEALVSLYKKTKPHEFLSITEFAGTQFEAADFAKTRYWGLAEQDENTDRRKTQSGMWRLTPHGRWFVQGKCTIPKYVWVYRAEPKLWVGENVSISQCFGEGFDIREVMVPGPATYR